MKTDANCIFCKIVAGQMPCFKLLEDDNTLAIMDIYPANDGHCLILAKEHYPTLFDIKRRGICRRLALGHQSRAGSQPGAIAGRTESRPGERARRPTVGEAFPCSHTTPQSRRPIKAELGRKAR
jgi:scavenger mRNA decapping enzyme DcpS-like protein